MPLLVLIIAFFSTTTTAGEPSVSVFRNVHVIAIDGTGLLRNRDVFIEGSNILWIMPHQPEMNFGDARIIDGSGQYLMPGLVDMHAHLPDGSDEDWPLDAYFKSYLDAGVTTLRSMRGHPQQLMWRAEILAGTRRGPHLVLSAPPMRREQAAQSDLAQMIRGFAEADYDFLKILSGFDAHQFAGLVEIAEQVELPITGHIPAAGLEAGVLAGMRSIEHMGALTRYRLEHGEAALRRLAQWMRQNDVFVCPTFETYEISKAIKTNEDLIAKRKVEGLPAPVVAAWQQRLTDYVARVAENPEKYQVKPDYLTKQLETGRILMEEHVGLLVSPSHWECLKPGEAMLIEMRHFEAMGMDRESILMSATSEPARAMGQEKVFGQIRANRRADLVLLGENPLRDLNALKAINGVMLKGKWLPKKVKTS
jgi:imidazolonepropionase-like amidohydrolase